MNSKLKAKTEAVKTLAESLKVNGVIDSYPHTNDNGLTRKIALEAITLNLSPSTETLLSNAGNISYVKDNRSATAYILDLIYGWFVEDIIIAHLKEEGIEVKLVGADAKRQFLKSGSISSDLDIEVTYPNGNTERFDIYFDSNGYWAKYNKIDIRESKWKTLVKHNAAMICISNEGVAIIDTNTEGVVIAPNNAWGGKPSATITNIKHKLQHISTLSTLINERVK